MRDVCEWNQKSLQRSLLKVMQSMFFTRGLEMGCVMDPEAFDDQQASP